MAIKNLINILILMINNLIILIKIHPIIILINCITGALIRAIYN